mmetsp:Transcript_104048/g.333546  ORF Transcript_104048/g.333546 Transcript_104048/m.333546 type:complete len:692 (+) Transcript_104048:90-2165(+)
MQTHQTTPIRTHPVQIAQPRLVVINGHGTTIPAVLSAPGSGLPATAIQGSLQLAAGGTQTLPRQVYAMAAASTHARVVLASAPQATRTAPAAASSVSLGYRSPASAVVAVAPRVIVQAASTRVHSSQPASCATPSAQVAPVASSQGMAFSAKGHMLRSATGQATGSTRIVTTSQVAPASAGPTIGVAAKAPSTIALPPPGDPSPLPSVASAAAAAAPHDDDDDGDELPSWGELRTRCDRDIAGAAELGRRVDLVSIGLGDLENGPTNSFARLRLFGRPESDVRVTLYRDSSGWCGFCQKVWLYLEEKSIPYRLEKGNLKCYGERASWVLEVNPKGSMPVVVLEGPLADGTLLPQGQGKVLTESKDIILELEAEFPDPPLMDRSPAGTVRMEEMYNLAAKITGYAFSSLLGQFPVSVFADKLDDLNVALKACEGPYLLEQFSLADIHLAPFLERARACLLFAKGLNVREKPRWGAVDKWFEAMENRPCYRGTQSDIFNLVHFLPPQAGWFSLENNPEEFIAAIDGTDSSWRLPLQPSRFEHNLFSESGALEAAMKVVVNHKRLTGFAQRTEASPQDASVDAAFRFVVCALLGDDPASLPLPSRRFGTDAQQQTVARAFRYVRDRVGVPRDMPLGAARHLRASFNELLERLGFDSRDKDLQTSPSKGLTYAPPGSKHVADLRQLAALAYSSSS